MNEAFRPLVSTALEGLWGDDHDDVIFLGQWCMRESRRHIWEALASQVIPYHWEDRSTIPSDLDYVNTVQEVLLPEIADRLNQLHKTSHSTRYWRIVIGGWLAYCLQVLFDRYRSLETAAGYESDLILLAPSDWRDLVPVTTVEEFHRACESDGWNAAIYATIAVKTGLLPVRPVNTDGARPCQMVNMGARDVRAGSGWRQKSNLLLHGILASGALNSAVEKVMSTNQRVALHATYLRLQPSLQLQLELRQTPQSARASKTHSHECAESMREWRVNAGGDRFAELVASLIPQLIPTCFVEGYSDLVSVAGHTFPPENPRVVVTATAYDSDVVWCEWAARQVESGSALVLLQHGGNYGIGKYSGFHDHELAIADRYLSWGWSDPGISKIVPAPATKLIGLGPRRHRKRRDECLLVTAAMPRYSYWIYSASFGPFMAEYYQDQFEFVRALNADVSAALKVRLFHRDYGWDQREIWEREFPNLRIDEGLSPIRNLENRARLYVSTYNATTFIESFARNIPTVMYWNPANWEVTERGREALERLERAGIYFSNPTAAAARVNEVWNSADEWWNGLEIRREVARFMSEFGYVGKRPIVELAARLNCVPSSD